MEPTRAAEIPHARHTEAEREAIRQQLERMLANPLFKNSKRYPNLLRYVVEHTLEGSPGELKERTLGVEVFGREPNYDTNADPVVRATAGEIRKRIAQYYHEHGRENEIRIDLSPGSYVPEFEQPAVYPALLPPPPVALAPAPRRMPQYVAVLAAIAALSIVVAWFKPWSPHSALDRFCGPVLDSPSTVLLCVGQRRFLGSSPEPGQQDTTDLPQVSDSPMTLFTLYYMGSQNVALTDATTLGRLSGLLQAKGKSYHIRGETSTSFADLRDGPVVLVGAFDNNWTMRLMGPLRFNYERDRDTFRIEDRQNPSRRDHTVNYATPYLQLTEDYALISRVLEPTTERMVVVAGGLTGYGTIAAGEFLTNPVYMEGFAKQAPRNWEHRNMQLLIATKVINGNSGPPRLVDDYSW